MKYIKTKYKIPYSEGNSINSFDSQIPIIWLEKQYLKTRNIKPDNRMYYLEYCECMEGMKCYILCLAEHFYYWIKNNYKQYKTL